MSNGSPDALAGIFVVFIALAALLAMAMLAFMIYCWWRIFAKAGYSGALAFLMLVPFGGLIVTCWLAFGDWPVLQELARLRERAGLPPDNRG